MNAERTIVILDLLSRQSMFGLDLVSHSDGKLKRGTVYVTLAAMEDAGEIKSEVCDNNRRKYSITSAGRTKLSEFQAATGVRFA